MVEHERFDGEKTTTQRRYDISSLAPEAAVLLRAVRQHRHIANKPHWILDVAPGRASAVSARDMRRKTWRWCDVWR